MDGLRNKPGVKLNKGIGKEKGSPSIKTKLVGKFDMVNHASSNFEYGRRLKPVIQPNLQIETPEQVSGKRVSWRKLHFRYVALNKEVEMSQVISDLYTSANYKKAPVGKVRKKVFHTPLFPPKYKEEQKPPGRIKRYWAELNYRQKMVVVTAVACLLSFGGGMTAVLKEQQSRAEGLNSQAIVIEDGVGSAVDFTTFLNTSLQNLDSYNQKPAGPDQLVLRKAKLKEYLKSMDSPFADDEVVIDAFLSIKHMKLVLAISFAESTMGKKCYYSNCSGIGGYVPNLRQYKEFRNWAIDLDDLLERRYKDWTISEMCGVYVQPCNENWPKAVNKVLNQLTALGF